VAFSTAVLLGARRSRSMHPRTSLHRVSMRWAPLRSEGSIAGAVVSWAERWCCMLVLAAIKHAIWQTIHGNAVVIRASTFLL
jgi:hypothetical protein